MNKSSIIVGLIIGLIVGFSGSYLFQRNGPVGNVGIHRMPDGSMMRNEMSNMMSGLSGKTGDDFDRAFLMEMIMHHEGAVDMAEAAQRDAKHQEIKTMAQAIITAQTSEIEQMKGWMQTWYGVDR